MPESFPQDIAIILGRESDLSFAEIEAVITSDLPISRPQPTIALVKQYPDVIEALQNKLGGAIKIARVFASTSTSVSTSEIAEIVWQEVAGKEALYGKGKVHFSVTIIGSIRDQMSQKQLTHQLKDKIETFGSSVRFIEGGVTGLSSVQLDTQRILRKGFELLVIQNGQELLLAETLAFQNYKDWSTRDYKRPKSDPKRGMLPPKVARMMLNIAAGHYQKQTKGEQIVLLDPFCGEGTILQEGLALGMAVYGSDIDKRAIADSEQNLKWFVEKFGIGQSQIKKLTTSDITQLGSLLPPESVDLVVTEPYLGPPLRHQPSQQEVVKLRRTVSSLFSTFLTQAHSVMRTGGIIGVVVPEISFSGFSQSLVENPLLDSCENFGYTLHVGPFAYARPDAKISRKLYFFRKLG